MEFKLGLGLTHFSNGAFEVPNSGINNFFMVLGLSQKRMGSSPGFDTLVNFPKNEFSKGLSYYTSCSIAWVEKLPVDGPKYAVYHLHNRLAYRNNRKTSLLLGIDFAFNNANAQKIRERPEFGPREGRLGLVLGHELHISKWSLLTEFGYDLIKQQTINPNLFQRYGFKYYPTKRLSAGIYLKVHISKAECIEWAIGYQLWQKKTKE